MMCFLLSIVGWIALIYLGMNLAGFMLRGLIQQQAIRDAGEPLLGTGAEEEVRKAIRRVVAMNVFGGFLCLAYLYFLFSWWNGFVAFIGLSLILLRIPDLLIKIRLGQEGIRKSELTPARVFTLVATFLALPFLWWSACIA